MHDRETVGLFLLAREDGMPVSRAAEFAGVPLRTAKAWAAGGLPHSYTGEPRRARIDGAGAGARRADVGEIRGLYEPAGDGPLSGMDPAQIENLLLRAVLDDLKAAGSHPLSTSMRSRCELGERLRRATGLPTSAITRFLEIPRSTWYYHRARAGRDRDGWLRPLVREAFEACGRRGYRAVHATLRRAGGRVSEKRVRRVMREEGLCARRRRRRYSSYRGEVSPAPPNLPLRADGTHDFSAARPNELWVTDLTEFRLPGDGKVYLNAVVDCYDGRPVAWAAGPSPTAALANSSLLAAASTLAPGEAPAVHSDRGAHYRWPGWVAICGRYGLERSMSRKARSGDNARAEGFFGTLKSEFFHPRDWAGWTREEFIAELDAWLRWFREGRISQALGWLTPDEHRLANGHPVA